MVGHPDGLGELTDTFGVRSVKGFASVLLVY